MHGYLHSLRARGFSLLEVLVATAVLATGLLALATLQGSLAQSSADAKVRGRVAAMLAARMDMLRGQGYAALAEGTTTVTSTTGDCDPASPDATDWIDCARIDAALASLSTTQTVTTYSGGSVFVPGPAPNGSIAQFRRVALTASWDDADGSRHDLALASDISAMALTDLVVPPPDDRDSAGGGPIVRTIDPATAGVIPIAMSPTATAATTNPVPELVGRGRNQEIVGTKFTVLNYTPPAPAGDVVIQKRFENELVKCRCRYGAGGDNLPEIFRTAQWPAIWTGDRYRVHAPASAAAAPGQALASGPRPGTTQSALCQECCRDHHDSGVAGEVRFDPERTDGTGKYELDTSTVPASLVAAPAVPGNNYVNACRVIRVDGFWRTASDMYARQFGLLPTQAVDGVAAKSGLPTEAGVSAYTAFVTEYLRQYDGTGDRNPPAGAAAMFDAQTGLNEPALVTIPQPSNSDYRYLHARALYSDHLEQEARDRLVEVLADTEPEGLCPEGTPLEFCVLPYLPFTTANLTEIATWLPVPDEGVLTVNSGNLLATEPEEPSGGRTIGSAAGTASVEAGVRGSNSGVAVSSVLAALAGVDPEDQAAVLGDSQAFEVQGTGGGPAFDVRVAGGGSNPFVFFTLGTDSDRECVKPAGADHHCVTATGTLLPQAGSVRVAHYWMLSTTSQSVSTTCSGIPATATVAVPTFHDYEVTAAAIAGVVGSIDAPVGTLVDESTTVHFGAIAENALVELTLAEQPGSPVLATIASCTTNAAGTEINDIVWNESWADAGP
jgi:prepilin-type N-terminal cleavage/methylation domain-containing protein